jgi:hypothetical protein
MGEDMRRRTGAAESVPASVEEVARAESVDRLVALLEDGIAGDARNARTPQDVDDVATRVRLLRLHRPISVEIFAMTDTDGRNFQEVGFVTADGTYVGVSAPRILCDHHDNGEEWPCAAVRSLARRHSTYARPLSDSDTSGR